MDEHTQPVTCWADLVSATPVANLRSIQSMSLHRAMNDAGFIESDIQRTWDVLEMYCVCHGWATLPKGVTPRTKAHFKWMQRLEKRHNRKMLRRR